MKKRFAAVLTSLLLLMLLVPAAAFATGGVKYKFVCKNL